MNLLPHNQMFFYWSNSINQIQQDKNVVFMWTTKYKNLLEICLVRNVATKTVFPFHPKNDLNSTTVKSAKPDVTCLIVHWRNENQQWILFGCDGIWCFATQTSRDYEKKSPLLKKFPRQSQFTATELETKMTKLLHMRPERVDLPLSEELCQTFNFWFVAYFFNLH